MDSPVADDREQHVAASDASPSPDVEVDATGLTCPLPVIELSRAVEGVEVGGTVRLLATDPTARVDVPVWCRMKRHRLLRVEQEGQGPLRFLVERSR
jgi:TusA-related sulfurtransferase